MLGLSVAAIALGYLSWRFVETPIRRGTIPLFASRRSVFTASAGVASLLIVLGMAGYLAGGVPSRFSSEQLAILGTAEFDRRTAYRGGTCFLDPDQPFTEFGDDCTPSGSAAMIWGDSHAAALSVGLREQVPALSQLTASGCPPLIGVDIGWRPHCKPINDHLLETVAATRPDTLYLHANWLLYADDLDIADLSRTVDAVGRASPSTRVVIVGGVPQWPPSLPEYSVRSGLNPLASIRLPNRTIRDVRDIDDRLRAVAEAGPALFISLIDQVCNKESCIAMVPALQDPKLMAWDYGHLTKEGSTFVAGLLTAQASRKYSAF